MIQTFKAIIDGKGNIRLLENIKLPFPSHILITILDEKPINEEALLSETALAKDWKRPEEEEAWITFKMLSSTNSFSIF